MYVCHWFIIKTDFHSDLTDISAKTKTPLSVCLLSYCLRLGIAYVLYVKDEGGHIVHKTAHLSVIATASNVHIPVDA